MLRVLKHIFEKLRFHLLLSLLLGLALVFAGGLVLLKNPLAPTVLFSDDFSSYALGQPVLDSGQKWENVALATNVSAKPHWFYAVGKLYHEDLLPADYSLDPKLFLSALVVAGSSNWTNYMFKVRINPLDGTGLGVVFRYLDPSNFYRFSMVKDSAAGGPYLRLEKKVKGELTTLAQVDSGRGDFTVYQWYRLKVIAQGRNLSVFIDEEKVLEATDNTLPAGKVGLFTWQQSGAFFDDVVVIKL